MIFVTVGTERFPFDRLIKAIDEAKQAGIIRDDVFIQTGSSKSVPEACAYSRWLSFDDMVEYMRQAAIIVCHAGVGTVLLARQNQKIPVVLARRAAFGEHVDDHQVEFAVTMAQKQQVIVAQDEQGLIEMIGEHPSLVSALPQGSVCSSDIALIAYLRTILSGTAGSKIS